MHDLFLLAFPFSQRPSFPQKPNRPTFRVFKLYLLTFFLLEDESRSSFLIDNGRGGAFRDGRTYLALGGEGNTAARVDLDG